MERPMNTDATEPISERSRSIRRGLLAQVGFLPIAAMILLGMLAGIGTFTFGYGQGAAYLSSNPGKWVVTADNGFFHSLAFTTGVYPDPIRIKPRNKRVAQNACLYCHSDFVHNMLPEQPGGDMLSCVHCHSDVGHAHR
jgi:cytochrome c nitrite reductase small subunit